MENLDDEIYVRRIVKESIHHLESKGKSLKDLSWPDLVKLCDIIGGLEYRCSEAWKVFKLLIYLFLPPWYTSAEIVEVDEESASYGWTPAKELVKEFVLYLTCVRPYEEITKKVISENLDVDFDDVDKGDISRIRIRLEKYLKEEKMNYKEKYERLIEAINRADEIDKVWIAINSELEKMEEEK